MYRRNYAYAVHVRGVKRFGGTITADSMEQAVVAVARRDTLTIEDKGSVHRACDGSDVPQAEWRFGNDKATMYVWAPPEYFVSAVPAYVPPVPAPSLADVCRPQD